MKVYDNCKSTKKIDHHDKCSGIAKFTDDIILDDMLYAISFRSTKAHAKIVKLVYPELEDGYFIIDRNDVPGENYVNMIFHDWPVFASDTVNYIGEPIAIIVGKDKAKLEEISKQIEIEYEELEPVFDYSNPVIHRGFTKGNYEEVKKKAKHVINETFETGYQEQAYLEPQGMIVYLEGEDKVVLKGSMQCPFYIKKAVMTALNFDEEHVRVIQPAVGGAFGGKEDFPSTIACELAVAILKVRKPIKIILEREEDMKVTTKRHPSTTEFEALVDENNHVIGIKSEVKINGGAYKGLSGVVLSRALIAVTNAYTIDNLDVNGDVCLTNTVPTGAFRGFGSPQTIFAIELFMNHIANRLGIDPLEFRLNHLVKSGDVTSTSGIFHDNIIMKEMIDKAMMMSNYKEKIELYKDKSKGLRGIGMSWFLHGCGFTGSGENTTIKGKVKLIKDENDNVFVYTAAVDMGQGNRTTLKRIVAKALDIDDNRVFYDAPDTDLTPNSGPTAASRTIIIVGFLLEKAALRLKKEWVSHKRQQIIEQYVQPDYIAWDEDKMIGDAYPSYSWGVNVVEVEVSPITYEVDVKHIWSTYDVGKAIDERIVVGQCDGGVLQGIGYGYLENMEVSNGRVLQKNLSDYIIPTFEDAPTMETELYDNPFPYGPFGAKGVGELTLVGGAPAVALAIENAIGRRINAIPATPEKIMELIKHGQD